MTAPKSLFRYTLSRRWGPGKILLFILLNPSTAGKIVNDPTVSRCQMRAALLGFKAIEIRNIFAIRATDPKVMKAAADPVGPENDKFIIEAARRADMVIAGWGAHGAHRGRSDDVLKLLRDNDIKLHHLGLTKAGQPRHPLYIGYSVEPIPL